MYMCIYIYLCVVERNKQKQLDDRDEQSLLDCENDYLQRSHEHLYSIIHNSPIPRDISQNKSINSDRSHEHQHEHEHENDDDNGLSRNNNNNQVFSTALSSEGGSSLSISPQLSLTSSAPSVHSSHTNLNNNPNNPNNPNSPSNPDNPPLDWKNKRYVYKQINSNNNLNNFPPNSIIEINNSDEHEKNFSDPLVLAKTNNPDDSYDNPVNPDTSGVPVKTALAIVHRKERGDNNNNNNNNNNEDDDEVIEREEREEEEVVLRERDLSVYLPLLRTLGPLEQSQLEHVLNPKLA